MGLLGATLPAGSQVKVGFEVKKPGFIGQSGDPVDYQNAIEGCVYSTGGFDYVQVAYKNGYVYDYATIVVTTTVDHGDIEDVGNWIQGAIQSCLPELEIVRRDTTVPIAGTPDNSGCQPGTHKSGWLFTSCVPDTAPPSQCDFSKMKWADWLACEIGITPSSAALVGAGLGIGAIVLIASLARR